MITPPQSRAARALLNWSREELALAAKVSLRTIVDFERGARCPHKATLDALRRAFEAVGIEFTNGGDREGVHLIQRKRSMRDELPPK